MIRKFDVSPGHREQTCPLNAGVEYCVSGSGVFTVEVICGPKLVYGVILREDYIQLPKFKENCQLRMVGRDTMTFSIYVSDDTIQ